MVELTAASLDITDLEDAGRDRKRRLSQRDSYRCGQLTSRRCARRPAGWPPFYSKRLPPRGGPRTAPVLRYSFESPPRFGAFSRCVGVCVVACLLEWLSQAFVRVLPGRALSRDNRRGTGFLPAGEPPHGAPTEAQAGQFHHRRDGGNARQGARLRGRREPVSARGGPRA